MSFNYTQVNNPTGDTFTFTPEYSDTAEIAVMGYDGKHWSEISVSTVDGQTVTLSTSVDGLEAIRISNNASKINASITNGSDSNVVTSAMGGGEEQITVIC